MAPLNKQSFDLGVYIASAEGWAQWFKQEIGSGLLPVSESVSRRIFARWCISHVSEDEAVAAIQQVQTPRGVELQRVNRQIAERRRQKLNEVV